MIDYAALPPEVNSGRMYSGAGAAPLMAAATAWDRLAATLGSAAGAYQGVVFELTDTSWQGPASASMTAAAEPYVQWMHATAAQAAQTANQARAAAAAYEAALAATVPPPVIAANRAALASLQATNVFGQNSAAIAANQADYGEMWAQDAAAMHAYAASSAAATTLTTFTPAPQTTNPADTANQTGTSTAQTATTAATQAANPITDFLNNNPLATFLHSDLIQAVSTLATGVDPFWALLVQQFPLSAAAPMFGVAMGATAAITGSQAFAGAVGLVPAFAASELSGADEQFTLAGSHAAGAGTAAGSASGSPGSGVSAGMGRATPVGGLSVPESWNAATPRGIRLAGTASPAAGSPGALAAPGSWLGGIPPVGGMVNTSRTAGSTLRGESTLQVIPRLAREAGGQLVGSQSTRTASNDPDDTDVLSDYEQLELEELRKAMPELMEKRDAAARSIREAIR